MITDITREVVRDGSQLRLTKLDPRESGYGEDIQQAVSSISLLGAVPEERMSRYKVTYSLDGTGNLEVQPGGAFRHLVNIMPGADESTSNPRGSPVVVCFIPREWIGKRVTRRVDLLQ